ncbi:MAG: hypothetical protein L0Y56_04705 [Nitrospira sp.]|nr:hypothetical protein [Nitrospira sp.]
MGTINIILEDEHGNPIEKVEGRIHLIDQFLPTLDNESFQCLRFIDPYGDTVFNGIQMQQFIKEWERIMSMAKTNEERNLLEQVKDLAKKCQSEPHRYLKFYGD